MEADESLQIRPYARLLTMLGDQLIKNERIALVELIKNSYDADSDWVTIKFENFGEGMEICKDSKIIIEDNGDGMTSSVIRNHWMNPATPNKLRTDESRITPIKKRVLQGEKGIGRFSTLKLGKNIKIITRPRDSDDEYIVKFDFTQFNDDFTKEKGVAKELFLDEIKISFITRKPNLIVERPIEIGYSSRTRENHGTIIEISELKGSWNEEKLRKVYEDTVKLQPIFPLLELLREKNDRDNHQLTLEESISKELEFEIWFYLNGKLRTESSEELCNLSNLLDNSPVLKITEGDYKSDEHCFTFKLNDIPQSLSFDDPNIRALIPCKTRFGTISAPKKNLYPTCGPFKFSFYIFDFSSKAPPKYRLDRKQKQLLKNHRIYLYRDGIRVYPYGDPDDDWLGIDVTRGTVKASEFASNDQTVGLVEISRKDNPLLKDKTNREGLIEEGDATQDFITTIQIFLSYLRHHPYSQYRKSLENQRALIFFKENEVKRHFETIKEYLKDTDNQKGLTLANEAEQIYLAERNFLVQRAETTEDLAGVGLSVETASHDIMSFMGKTLHALDDLSLYCVKNNDLNSDFVFSEISKIKGMLTFVDSQLKDIQLLFRSAKKRRRNIRIKDMLNKVINIYKKWLKDEKIELNIIELGSPLIAKTTEAVILQLLINLFDNAIWWLETVDKPKKEILITLDGQNGKLIFSDNGPGVRDDDMPYIFEAFYSGKGAEGRGLGLYIARQLLERHDYSIDLVDLNSEKKLPGANFIVNFILEGERSDS